MISLETAQKLKASGLVWKPVDYDAFFVPVQDLDEKLFFISDMSVLVEQMGGDQAITFNGTAEWALDHVIVGEAVWVPREDQLREMVETRLVERGEEQPVITLTTTTTGYNCQIRYAGGVQDFQDFGASETYAKALLFLLGKES